MNNEDQQPSIGNTGNRNYSPQKYPEKMPNYSPSTSYNYGHQGGYGGMQQHPRRRADRFKRESINLNDKVVKQNDIIIRLLKEIRDRLPAPANQEPAQDLSAESSQNVQDAQSDDQSMPEAGEQPDQTNDFQ
jgi:hypothetical protein